MLNLDMNMAIDIDSLNKNFMASSDYSANNDNFSKIFDDVNKSFEATKEKLEDENKKDENDKDKDKEANSAEPNTILEQLLLSYKNTLTQNLPQENQEGLEGRKSLQALRDAGEKLLHQRQQSLELTTKFINDMQNLQAKAGTQNPIQTQAQQMLNASMTEAGSGEVMLTGEALLNLQNTAKLDGSTTLADALSELKVEITSVKAGTQTESKGFDFNSSSFGSLSSHLTKLSLNKSVDFSKVINQKLSQEQQILNQVREATASQLAKGTSHVNIVLRPESLGRINVHISSANGAVTAQFTAQSQQAAEVLSKNIETLRQNLLEQGVKVSDVTVRVQTTSQGEALADKNFNQENFFNSSKENYSSSKNAYSASTNSNNNNNNNNNEEHASLNQNITKENTEEEELSHSSSINNNDLGIYNNKGRKV